MPSRVTTMRRLVYGDARDLADRLCLPYAIPDGVDAPKNSAMANGLVRKSSPPAANPAADLRAGATR